MAVEAGSIDSILGSDLEAWPVVLRAVGLVWRCLITWPCFKIPRLGLNKTSSRPQQMGLGSRWELNLSFPESCPFPVPPHSFCIKCSRKKKKKELYNGLRDPKTMRPYGASGSELWETQELCRNWREALSLVWVFLCAKSPPVSTFSFLFFNWGGQGEFIGPDMLVLGLTPVSELRSHSWWGLGTRTDNVVPRTRLLARQVL